jgi:PQQ-like domain
VPATPEAVLADYVARMRRLRRRYAIVLAIIVVAAVVLTEVVLRTGEIAHAKLHSAKSAVPAPTASAPSTTPVLAWHSTDTAAIGNPGNDGTVVTYSAHTVTGRNYATGAAVWTYTRTDLTICTVIQEFGTTVAFFDLDGNCDEVDAFTTDTGARSWYRTLDSNGTAINGRPTYIASQYTIMMTTSQVVWAIDPGSGLDRWMFVEPKACTTTTAALGSSGALIGQHCTDGYHLTLRDPLLGNDDTGKTKTIKWDVKSTGVIPASADSLISAFDPQTGQLIRYQETDGKVLGTAALTPAPDLKAPISTLSQTGADLISVGPTSYWVSAGSGQRIWSAQLTGPPSQVGPDPLAISSRGIVDLNTSTGDAKATYQIPAPPAGSRVYPLGTGFVVASTSTAVYR